MKPRAGSWHGSERAGQQAASAGLGTAYRFAPFGEQQARSPAQIQYDVIKHRSLQARGGRYATGACPISPRQPGDEKICQQSVQGRQQIVEHHAKTVLEAKVEVGDRRRLEDIEGPEQDEG